MIATFSTSEEVGVAAVATKAAIIPRVNVECAVPPAASVSVTVYVPEADADVGVPVICPVVVLSVKPAGSAGETEYVTGKTPALGVTGVNGVALVPVVNDTGVDDPVALSAALPTRVNEPDATSCVGEEESVAVIVNIADPDWAASVPVIAPVLVLKLRALGSDGEIE